MIAKSKIEACRDPVTYATRNDTIVSCTEARWICSADAECGKALEYYHLLCRNMFRGKKCSERCKNSLNILQRQEKAAKLLQCQCGFDEKIEDFQCSDIKANMENLCFEKEETTTEVNLVPDESENEIDIDTKPKVNSASVTNHMVQSFAVILILKYI